MTFNASQADNWLRFEDVPGRWQNMNQDQLDKFHTLRHISHTVWGHCQTPFCLLKQQPCQGGVAVLLAVRLTAVLFLAFPDVVSGISLGQSAVQGPHQSGGFSLLLKCQ